MKHTSIKLSIAEGRGLEPLRAFARLFSRQVPYHSAQPSFSFINSVYIFFLIFQGSLENKKHPNALVFFVFSFYSGSSGFGGSSFLWDFLE